MNYKIIISFVFVLFLISSASAVSNFTRSDAESCINNSVQIMKDMSSQGLNVLRINDSLRQAQILYDSQVVLLEKNRKYDFSFVQSYCDEIVNIYQNSTSALDDYSVLLKFYNDTVTPGMNTSTIDFMIGQIKNEITNERYENVKALVDQTYSEIINVKSSSAALNVFVSYTTTSLKKFILNNWRWMLSVLIILTILFIVYRIRILKWLIQRKIDSLNLRKKTLKELIMKVQKNYFEIGKMSEAEYNIKTKKFAELIRDIDRQLPLLQEELYRFKRKDKPVAKLESSMVMKERVNKDKKRRK